MSATTYWAHVSERGLSNRCRWDLMGRPQVHIAKWHLGVSAVACGEEGEWRELPTEQKQRKQRK